MSKDLNKKRHIKIHPPEMMQISQAQQQRRQTHLFRLGR